MSTSHCRAELCPNWSGDGNVCPCALFDLEPRPRLDLGNDPDGDLEGADYPPFPASWP